MSTAATDVLNERNRQRTEEGFTLDRDDAYSKRELARAAGAYVQHYYERAYLAAPGSSTLSKHQYTVDNPPDCWPFDLKSWKPKNRRYDLVRAAALLLAEIERLDRLESPEAFSDALTILRIAAAVDTPSPLPPIAARALLAAIGAPGFESWKAIWDKLESGNPNFKIRPSNALADTLSEIGRLQQELKDHKEVLADKRHLAHELDVKLNGNKAAKSPALIDILSQFYAKCDCGTSLLRGWVYCPTCHRATP